MKKKEEGMKVSDSVRMRKSTSFVAEKIPSTKVPSSRTFDIKRYRSRNWVLVFMDEDLYNKIEELSKKRGLDPREVIYGSLIKLKTILK